MKSLSLVFAASLSLAPAPLQAQQPDTTEVIVMASDDASSADLAALRSRVGGQPVSAIPSLGAEVWRVPQQQAAAFLRLAAQSPKIVSADYVGGDYRSLFLGVQETALGDGQSRVIAQLRTSGELVNVSAVRLRAGDFGSESLKHGFGREAGLIVPGSIVLRLGPNLDVIASRRQLDTDAEGRLHWTGEVRTLASATPGFAALSMQGDKVLGIVTIGTDTYSIRPLGDGVHAVGKLDPAKVRPDHPEEEEEGSDETDDAPPPVALAPPGLGTPLVTIAVAYTPAVARGIKAMNAEPAVFVALLEKFTNESFYQSGVQAQIKVVATSETPLSEGWNISSELKALVDPSDGRMDALHNWRRSVRANALILLVSIPGGNCGKSAAILPPAPASFAVVDYQCAAGANFSFAHELGHLFGARHDNDPKDYPFPYGRGYRYKDKFRTIMAYTGGECISCPRIPRWANPAKLWEGIPTGTAARNNDARAIAETAPILVRYGTE